MKKLLFVAFGALLLIAFSAPAMADMKIGGIVFTDFVYYTQDKGGDKWGQTKIQVPHITRLYGRWTNEDNVGMYIEFGIGGQQGKNTDVVCRHAYGWWDVNPNFQIMAGQSTTPFSPLNPSQLVGTTTGGLHIIGVGYGEYYSGRYEQVRFTFKFSKNARLAIALVDPNGAITAVGQNAPVGSPLGAYKENTKVPRIDVGLPLYLGNIKLYPSAFWQKRTWDDVPTGIDDEVTTYGLSLGINLGIGPLAIEAEGNYGQNMGNSLGLIGLPLSAVYSNAGWNADNTVDDSTTWSYWFDVSFKLGVATPHLIYGKQKSEGDKLLTEADSTMYGVSIPIDLAKGFRVRPEFMWYDNGDNNKSATGTKIDSGKEAVYAVQFQITF